VIVIAAHVGTLGKRDGRANVDWVTDLFRPGRTSLPTRPAGARDAVAEPVAARPSAAISTRGSFAPEVQCV